MKASLQRLLNRTGYRITRLYPRDLTPETAELVARVRPYTMTSVDSVAAMVSATEYLTRNEIPGAVAECGVWRGGSMMAVALTLLELGDTSRDLYLYDTFAGMTPPTEADVRADGMSAFEPGSITDAIAVGREQVAEAMRSTGYPEARIHLVEGRVEETLPAHAPDGLALLRLDTDWYESTRHELEHLFPRLAPGGILVVDDYGHWEGARRAVDEYVDRQGLRLYLHRVDYTVRLAVKQEGARGPDELAPPRG